MEYDENLSVIEYDENLSVIKYEGSKLKAIQNLIDKLNTTIGQPKYTWKNLEDTVSLAEQIQEIADVLKGLEDKSQGNDCSSHYTGNKANHTTTYNGCSSNKSSVKASVCTGNHDFSSCICYNNDD